MPDQTKIPVSERALLARIQRKLDRVAALANDQEARGLPLDERLALLRHARVVKARPNSIAKQALGTYQFVAGDKVLVAHIEDLAGFCREWDLGVLDPWERLE